MHVLCVFSYSYILSHTFQIHDDQINYDFCLESGRTFLSTSNQRKIPDTARDVDISVDTSSVADNGNDQCSHTPPEFHIKGIQIFLDFVTGDEEEKLVRKIEETPYVNSQSGRRKQASLILLVFIFYRLHADPPENCHLTVKKLPKT